MGVSAGCAHKAEAIRDSKIPHNQGAHQLLLSETYKTNKLALGVVVTTCYLHSKQLRITKNIQDITRAQLRIDSVSHKGSSIVGGSPTSKRFFFLLSHYIYVIFDRMFKIVHSEPSWEMWRFLAICPFFVKERVRIPVLLQVGESPSNSGA